MTPQPKISVAFADDKDSERKSILRSLNNLNNCCVLFSSTSGRDMIFKLQTLKKLPDIILMDMEMPCCDGLLATTICKRLFPQIKIVGLSSHCSFAVISEFISEGGSAFFSKYLLDKESVCYRAYAEKDVFEKYLEKVVKCNDVFFDPLLQFNSDKNYKTNPTFSIIKNRFPELKDHEIIYLQLNAAGFSKPEIKTLMCREVATIKKYYEKLSKFFGAQTHSDLTSICLNYGIVKMVHLYERFKLFEE